MSAFTIAQQAARFAGEVAWIAGWSIVVGHWLDSNPGPALPGQWVAGFVLVAAILAATISRSDESRRSERVGVSILGLLGALLAGLLVSGISLDDSGVRSLVDTPAGGHALLAVVIALVSWWRGSRLGTIRPTVDEVEGNFRFGIFALAALFGIVAVIGPSASPGLSATILPAFTLVAAGLLGVPLARVADVAAGPRSDTPQLAPTGPWLATLVLIVGALMIVTAFIAGVVTVDRVAVFVDLLANGISRVLWILFMVVAIPLGYLVEFLVNLLRGLTTSEGEIQIAQELPAIEVMLRDVESGSGVSSVLVTIVEIALGLALVLIVVLLLARVLRRRGRWASESDGVDEYRDLVLDWESIRGLLARLFGRVRHPAVVPWIAVNGSESLDPTSIREVYREFLRFTTRLGVPRTHAETPFEYRARLERSDFTRVPRPDASGPLASAPIVGGEELAELTEAYIRVRYARPAETRADAGPAARALERLRALWSRRG